MKKLTLILSVILCLAMMLSFVSCGSSDGDKDVTTNDSKTEANESKTEAEPKDPEELIVGEWEGEMKFQFGEIMAMQMGEEYGEYFEDVEISVFLNLEITDDGEYALTVDEDATEGSIDDAKDGMKDGMKKLLEEMAEMYGSSLEEMVAAEGYDDIDEYLDDAVAEMDMESMLSEFSIEDVNGKYEIDDDKIYLIADGEDKDEDDYAIFEVSEDELVIDMPEEMLEEVDEEMLPVIEMMLPLELERK